MNDLAEKALEELGTAWRTVRAHPTPALAALGAVAGSVVVVTGARIGAAPAAVPIDRWAGLLPEAGYRVTGPAMGAVMVGAVVVLALTWLLTLRVIRVRALTVSQTRLIAVVWALPFLIGPPIQGTDVFGYLSHGLLARDGLDPYAHGPTALGPLRVVDAIDPTWRGAPATDGPLALLGQHLVVTITGGGSVAGLLLLRAIAVISLVVAGRAAVRLTRWAAPTPGAPTAASALCLVAANPAALINVVSGANLAGPLAALLLTALVEAQRRRWSRAVVLACLAAAVKPVALLAVAAIALAHVRDRDARVPWASAARDLVLAAAVLGAAALAVPDGLGWLGNLTSAAREHVTLAPSNLVGAVVGAMVPGANVDDLAVGGRIAAGAAAVTVIAFLFATIQARPVERTVGLALLAAGLLAPVLYPPFLLWGVLCLAPTATGALRDSMIAASAAACVLAPTGFDPTLTRWVSSLALVVIGLVLLPRIYWRRDAPVAAPVQPDRRLATSGGGDGAD